MKLREATETLMPGAVVRWNDPDNDECSRTVVVSEARIRSDETLVIMCHDGTTLECLPSELEAVQ